jgi:hypothetical protein
MAKATPYPPEATAELLAQMVGAMKQAGKLSPVQRGLVAAFTFVHSTVLKKALGDTDHGQEMLHDLVALLVEQAGVAGTLDAIACKCFEKCSDLTGQGECDSVEANAWRRVGSAVLQTRNMAKGNGI